MRLPPAVFALGIAACASSQAAPGVQPQDVRFISGGDQGRDAVKGCKMLGVIDSSDKTNGGSVTQMPVERDAHRRLQNEAARLGANTVLLTASPVGMASTSAAYGEAYSCTHPVGGRM